MLRINEISGDTINGRTIECSKPVTFYFVGNVVPYINEICSEISRMKWVWVTNWFDAEKGSNAYFFYTENLKIKCIHNVYRSKNGTKTCFYVIGRQKKDANDRLLSVQYGLKMKFNRGIYPVFGDKTQIPMNTYSIQISNKIDGMAIALKNYKQGLKAKKDESKSDFEEQKINFGSKLKSIVAYMESYESQTKPDMQYMYNVMEPVISNKIIGVEYKFTITNIGENKFDESLIERQVIISKEPIITEEELQLKGIVVNVNDKEKSIIVSFQATVDFGKFPKAGFMNFTTFNISYAVQSKAIDALVQGKSVNRVLLDIILFNSYKEIPMLKEAAKNSQEKAVQLAANTEDFLLVQGPPGTGKTTIIIKIIKELINKGERVLISSKNNLAVDNVLQKCIEENIPAVRLGREETVKIAEVKNILIDRAAVALQKNIINNCDKEELEVMENSRLQGLFVEKVKDNFSKMQQFNEELIEIKKLERKLKLKKYIKNVIYFYKLFILIFDKAHNFIMKKRGKEIKNIVSYEEFINSKLMSDEKYLKVFNNRKELSLNMQGIKLAVEAVFEGLKSYKVFKYEGLSEEVLKAKLKEEEELSNKLNMKRSIIFDWKKSLEERQQSLYPLLLNSVNVVGATCIGVNTNVEFKDIEFDTVIIDEAGQITLFDVLVPISRAKKVILIGDHKQLPPVSEKKLAEGIEEEDGFNNLIPIYKDFEELMGKSLFESLYYNAPEEHKVMLDTQYRMHPVIADFISKEFYDNKYKSGLKETQREIKLESFNNSLYFMDTCYEHNKWEDEAVEEEHKVYYNSFEAELTRDILIDILTKDNYSPKEIGVIAPYKRQKLEIQNKIKNALIEEFGEQKGISIFNMLEIDTVDSFQGRDKNIIIYSFTRSNKEGRIGFLRELRRLNVTMTRAKYLLIMIGDSETLLNANDMNSRKCFKNLIEYVRVKGIYKTAKEWWKNE